MTYHEGGLLQSKKKLDFARFRCGRWVEVDSCGRHHFRKLRWSVEGRVNLIVASCPSKRVWATNGVSKGPVTKDAKHARSALDQRQIYVEHTPCIRAAR